jgi:predicted DNA-binding antitoxin AbrB/MazE fold protein
MNKIRAIYGNGVFRPEERVELPDGTAVELEFRTEPTTLPPLNPEKKISAINAILAEQARTLKQRPASQWIESGPS